VAFGACSLTSRMTSEGVRSGTREVASGAPETVRRAHVPRGTRHLFAPLPGIQRGTRNRTPGDSRVEPRDTRIRLGPQVAGPSARCGAPRQRTGPPSPAVPLSRDPLLQGLRPGRSTWNTGRLLGPDVPRGTRGGCWGRTFHVEQGRRQSRGPSFGSVPHGSATSLSDDEARCSTWNLPGG